MKRQNKILVLDGVRYRAEVDVMEESDKENLIEMYTMWNDLSNKLSAYGCRRVNFPELSELIFCAFFNCWRTNNTQGLGKHSSFDCYNPETEKMIQIKAASASNELTSFGPDSVWDEIYFMDFYNGGNYDGTFEVYLLPNEAIYSYPMNKNETFRDQQLQKRRPRFSIRKLIKQLRIRPIGVYNLYDL